MSTNPLIDLFSLFDYKKRAETMEPLLQHIKRTRAKSWTNAAESGLAKKQNNVVALSG